MAFIMAAVPEGAVLMDQARAIADSDEWPVYHLKQVSISSQATGLPVSLFAANRTTFIKVVGYLEKIDDDQAQLGMLHTP